MTRALTGIPLSLYWAGRAWSSGLLNRADHSAVANAVGQACLMSVVVENVTEAALTMSEQQRAALAEALLDSLDGHAGPRANSNPTTCPSGQIYVENHADESKSGCYDKGGLN